MKRGRLITTVLMPRPIRVETVVLVDDHGPVALVPIRGIANVIFFALPALPLPAVGAFPGLRPACGARALLRGCVMFIL